MIAIGRSRLLYDTIGYLSRQGEQFEAIITAEAYPEYDIKEDDFRALAEEINANFFKTKNLLLPEIIKLIKEKNIDIGISVNWRYRIDSNFLNLFKEGILNFHLGNLPDYKGNATANWAILNGEKFIYANIHKMALELDSGDIVAKARIKINSDTYVGDVWDKAKILAPKLFGEAIEKMRNNSRYYLEKGSPNGLRCYPRLEEDHQINWFMTAEEVYRLIRASSRPYSGAFSFLNGRKVTVWKARIVKPGFKFLAIPGQVVGINKDSGFVSVACSDKFLELQEVEVDNNLVIPAVFVETIRARFKYKHS